MILWRSVVGKLWVTILLLVSFVLFILTVLLLEFFQNYHKNEIEQQLSATASRIVTILHQHEDMDTALKISSELMGKATKVIVIEDKTHDFASENISRPSAMISFIRNNPELSNVMKNQVPINQQMELPANTDGKSSTGIIVGVPVKLNGEKGAVFLFQSLEAMEATVHSTTKFIWLAAGVAAILTTIFAFFLSTRITAPLRKMREAAFEVARGKFDTKVPILTHDEIGELATAFNQMGKQLKFNLNALSQEKESLASILSSMADGVITFNRDGTILTSNPPAERFLQYWYKEKGFIQGSHDAVPSVLMKLFEQTEEFESEQVGEISIQNHYWVLIVSPLYNNKSIRGAVAVLRDMTEERSLEKLRKDFIANVSHELRTPIAMLQGYSEAIIDDIGTVEDKKEMAQIIYEESLRMGRLVNDLLDLARMEAGHISLNYEKVSIAPYLKRVVYKFQGLAKEKDIEITVEITEPETEYSFDPDKIEQVLTNLIDNAIRHTPEGGAVKIVQSGDAHRGLMIKVQDSGSGIPKEDLPFVFERFYKADKDRTRGRSGTGLGLAIAQNIIRSHDGKISVTSELEKGTTFYINIPRKMQEIS
ncbi:two-component system sensor histidine kinase ResE [Peribacillus deserti]|uniref:histidine kinase n=1 Tax=Peribacillus deserti TaxID=673318 RepID=A0ABS2QNV4_9BACI|nr:ATP-binding protein [Peribacillus deserti]MBM7694848.1 two-component system sensor histidine kinase ResE [Peribacillus deserti]